MVEKVPEFSVEISLKIMFPESKNIHSQIIFCSILDPLKAGTVVGDSKSYTSGLHRVG